MQDLDIEEKFLMQHIKELYEYREMIISLVRKDLRGRYKGSVITAYRVYNCVLNNYEGKL